MKYFKTFTAIFIATLLVGMTSCDKNQTHESNDAALLIGEWLQTWSKGSASDSSNPEFGEEWNEAVPESDAAKITFNEDGSGYNTYPDDPNSYNFNWTKEGDKLTLVASDGDSFIATVVSLTNEQLIIEEKEIDGTFEAIMQDTFTRIK